MSTYQFLCPQLTYQKLSVSALPNIIRIKKRVIEWLVSGGGKRIILVVELQKKKNRNLLFAIH